MQSSIVKCFIILALFAGSSFHASANHSVFPLEMSVIADSVPAPVVRHAIFRNADQSFGYDILVNGKLRVHQPYIPCVEGNRGFASMSDASKAAELVVVKVKKGIMPPTLTIEELKAAGIKW